MRLFQDFRDRRIIQIMASYAAVAWIVLEVVDQLVDRGVLPDIVYLVVLVWVIGGLGLAAVTGWYHGEKGDQAVTRPEVILLGVIALGTLGASVKTVIDYRERQAVAGVLDAATGLDPRRLAVLYFQDFSAGGEMSFLADGLTEDLIDELGGVRGIDVVSRNGTGQYRGSALPADSVARLLGAGTFVEGSVQQRGEDVRVEVALRDAESGVTIERGSFDLPVDSATALRAGLEGEVSRFLRTWLGEEIRLRTGRSRDVSDASWILVQRAERAIKDGKALYEEDDDEGAAVSFDRADDLLAQAQAVEPGWADPLARRGRLAYERARMEGDVLDANDLMTVAVGFLDEGLGIEPRNADALEVRGMVRYWRWLMALEPDHDAAERLLDDAEKDLRAATQINALQANAWNVLGHLYYQLDDIVEANRAAREAYEADAFLTSAPDILWRLWSTSYDLENKTQSRQWCEEGRRRFPDNPRFYQCELWNMTSGATDADPDRAWTLVDEVLRRTPEHERDLTRLQMRVLVAGTLANASGGSDVTLADSARSVLDRSGGDADIDPTRELLMTQAFVRTLLGDDQEAVDLLQRYLTFNPERREGFAQHGHWWWRQLRSDPAYQRMIGG
jgi:TolB-like protein